jgi:hypothetical protein
MAIDLTLPQHEIQVEPAEIRPVKPHRRKALVGYGQLGRLLLKVLRSQNDWLTARELTTLIGAHIEGFELINPRHTLECVRRRLNQLAKSGVVERQSLGIESDSRPRNQHGRWRLTKTKRIEALLALGVEQAKDFVTGEDCPMHPVDLDVQAFEENNLNQALRFDDVLASNHATNGTSEKLSVQ